MSPLPSTAPLRPAPARSAPPPARPDGWGRAWRLGLCAACCALLFAVLAPLALVWPTLAWRNRLSLLAGRLVSRVSLRVWGVRLRVVGQEHLRHPAILTYNHTSSLDWLVLAPLAGRRCLVFGKRELARVPVLGWGWLLGGHPLIQREQRGHWQGHLDRAADLMRDQGYSALLAPEGTRSRTGALLPFKKGAFHLALATRLPIVPVVIEGGLRRMRDGLPTPGEVTVRVLPAIDTRAWRRDRIDLYVAAVRSRYLSCQDEARLARAGT